MESDESGSEASHLYDSAGHRLRAPVVEIGGNLYLFHPGRERVWKYRGQTKNPRAIATRDAAVWNGALLTVHTDGVRVMLQHHIAGIEQEMLAFEWLEEEVAVFDEVDQLREGEVAEWVEGS